MQNNSTPRFLKNSSRSFLFIICIYLAHASSVQGQTAEGVSNSVYLNFLPQTEKQTQTQVAKEERKTETASPDAEGLVFKPLRKVGASAIAVIIGNKDYDAFPEVKYAQSDAALFNQFLTESFGFKNSNIIYEPNANYKTINSLFGTSTNHKGKLYNQIEPGITQEVWIYYAGHAGPNGNDPNDKTAYLLATDSEKDAVSTSAYPLETLYANLDKLPVKKVVVVLEACFSGQSLGYANSATLNVNDVFKARPTLLQKGVVLSAAKNNQFACWDETNEHGLFTFELFKAISSGKKCDFDQNGKVTFEEVIEKLNDSFTGVPAKAKAQYKNQNPTVQGGLKSSTFFTLAP